MNSAEAELMDTELWYIAHIRRRLVALESHAAALETQSLALNTQLHMLRSELDVEIVTATEELLIAAHESRYKSRNGLIKRTRPPQSPPFGQNGHTGVEEPPLGAF